MRLAPDHSKAARAFKVCTNKTIVHCIRAGNNQLNSLKHEERKPIVNANKIYKELHLRVILERELINSDCN